MSGVLSVARSSRGGDSSAGMWSAQWLAATDSARELSNSGLFSWCDESHTAPLVHALDPHRPRHQQPDWFMSDAVLIEYIVSEVELQIPKPNTAEAVAELNSMLRSAVSSELASSGAGDRQCNRNISQIVSKVCSLAQHIVEAAEERAAQRQALATAANKGKKVAVAFGVVKLSGIPGALGEDDLSVDEKAIIEERLRRLHALGEEAHDELQKLQMHFQDGNWRLNLNAEGSRFVFIPKTSIRVTDVVEVFEGGKRYFDVTLKGVPMFEGGRLVFGEMHGQRFAADELKAHGNNPQTVAEAMRKMTLEQTVALMQAERERLKQLAEQRARSVQLAPTLASSISGGANVTAADLCTFSPNAAALSLLPLHKASDRGAELTH